MTASLTDEEIRARLRALREGDPVERWIHMAGGLLFALSLLLPGGPTQLGMSFRFWLVGAFLACLLLVEIYLWNRHRFDRSTSSATIEQRYGIFLNRALLRAEGQSLGGAVVGFICGGIMIALCIITSLTGTWPSTIYWILSIPGFSMGLGSLYAYRVVRPRLQAEWREWEELEAAQGAPATPAAALQP